MRHPRLLLLTLTAAALVGVTAIVALGRRLPLCGRGRPDGLRIN